MKIGFVTGEYPPMEGGVGAFTQELARAMAHLGHQIHILTAREAARPEKIQFGLPDPVDIQFAQLHPLARQWRGDVNEQITSVALRYDLELINIQYQAAAYDMRSSAINRLPRRLRGLAKTAVTFHDLRTPYLFPKAGPLRRYAVNYMARQADGVIVTNDEDFEQLTKQRHLQSLIQIPIGSNINSYTPDSEQIGAAREKLGLRPTDHLLGYFGFLNETKGADTLVRAMSQLSEQTHLLFIGGQTGSSDTSNNQTFLGRLKQEVESLGLTRRIHWTGFLPDLEVSTFLNACDLMVMPYQDGVSLRRGTLMAVLAHKRPLLTTTPTIPTPNLVHGKNCWLVPPNDVPQLVEAANHLLTNPQLRTTIGQQAGQISQLFSWDKIAAQTADFFTTLF